MFSLVVLSVADLLPSITVNVRPVLCVLCFVVVLPADNTKDVSLTFL